MASRGTSPADLRDRVADGLKAGRSVMTADARSEQVIDGAGLGVLTSVVLAFAVLAMFVAAVVIANTFTVLLAQRTRLLALLRCVGATRRQVRRQVIGEALLLGLTASVVGTAVATGLVAAGVVVLSRSIDGLPGGIEVTPVTVLVPVLLGVAATVLAAIPAARSATRVAPLAALRPPPALGTGSRASRLRVVLTVLLIGLGITGLAGGVALGREGSSAGVLLALLGGAGR